jgi:hypothetical protein
VTLHSTRKTHTPRGRAGIHVLSYLKKIRLDDAADFRQAFLALDAKFSDMLLQGHLVCSEMASLGSSDIARLFASRADLYSPVAMDVAALVADDLAPLNLKYCARHAFGCDGVVNSRHALLDAERAGTMREGEFLSLKRCPFR